MPRMLGIESRNICVYGYDQVAVSLKEKYEEIVFFRNNEDLLKADFASQKCQVFYISQNKNAEFEAIKLANASNVISVSIDENFIEKSGTILVQMGRRNFELSVNHAAMKRLNIKLDPVLEGLVIN
jgi:hypothetical protein